jgi:hypothetical protein
MNLYKCIHQPYAEGINDNISFQNVEAFSVGLLIFNELI